MHQPSQKKEKAKGRIQKAGLSSGFSQLRSVNKNARSAGKRRKKKAFTASIALFAMAVALTSCSLQTSSQTGEEMQESAYTAIDNPEMAALLESGTPWSRVADSLEEDNLSSISFGSGYYSMELADGNKINAQYEFLADPETEDESSSALVLFKEISSAGDASARVEIIDNEGENALVLTFEDDPISSEAAEKLGLSEEVYFYNKESLEKIQSKEKAKQQQQERQQEAQRLKEENGQNTSNTTSNSNPEESSESSLSDSENAASTNSNSGQESLNAFVTSFLPQYSIWSCPGAVDSSTPRKTLTSLNFYSDGTVISHHLDGSTGSGTWKVSDTMEAEIYKNGVLRNEYAFDLIFPEFSIDGQSFQDALIQGELFLDSNTDMGPNLDVDFSICPELGKLITVNGTNLSLFGMN